jgi:hypothetical protein
VCCNGAHATRWEQLHYVKTPAFMIDRVESPPSVVIINFLAWMSNHEAEARLGQRTLVPSESMRQRRQTSGANALKSVTRPRFQPSTHATSLLMGVTPFLIRLRQKEKSTASPPWGTSEERPNGSRAWRATTKRAVTPRRPSSVAKCCRVTTVSALVVDALGELEER